MKIKRDFVTNSSSTSYLIGIKGDLSEELFFENLGIKTDAEIKKYIKEVFNNIKSNMTPIREYIKKNDLSLENFIKKDFSESVLHKILTLETQGKTIYYGTLSSESDF